MLSTGAEVGQADTTTSSTLLVNQSLHSTHHPSLFFRCREIFCINTSQGRNLQCFRFESGSVSHVTVIQIISSAFPLGNK